jgi:site-specific DNA-methyltransferase (adenine-specific)
LFSNGPWKREKGDRTDDITHDEWLELTNGVWTLPGESNPWEGFDAAFPVAVPYRLIKLLSYREDTILDPFLGSGSTMAAAWRLGRARFIGRDIDQTSVDSSLRRLAALQRGGLQQASLR